MVSNNYINDIAEQSSKALEGKLDTSSVRPIRRPIGKDKIKDASLAFYIDGIQRFDDVVLLVSNPCFGQTVFWDINCAQEVATKVDQAVASHIARPIHQGKYGDQTYAVFSRLSPLSGNNIIRSVQKPFAAKRLTSWLSSLAEQTKQVDYNSQDYDRLFLDPLKSLSQDNDISRGLRDLARSSAKKIQEDRRQLFTVVQHGDLWSGNIFFERRRLEELNPFLGKFYIIDWGGVHLDGYPCIDLVRLCLSLYRADAPTNSALIQEYGDSLCISSFDMSIYILLALGRLGAELNQFPKERYSAMCSVIFSFIQRHILEGKVDNR